MAPLFERGAKGFWNATVRDGGVHVLAPLNEQCSKLLVGCGAMLVAVDEDAAGGERGEALAKERLLLRWFQVMNGRGADDEVHGRHVVDPVVLQAALEAGGAAVERLK